MGVYIRGMEMPGKGEYHMTLYVCLDGSAYIDVASFPVDEDRFELVPVPEHGDLIDRNELYEKTAELEAQSLHMVETTMNDEDKTEWRKWSAVLTERSAFKFDVADAPTIIPASEETED